MAEEKEKNPPENSQRRRSSATGISFATRTRRRTTVQEDETEFRSRRHSTLTQGTIGQDTHEENGLEWKDSSKVKKCPVCQKNFSLTNRKHHCRQCGGVFCGKCSCYEIVIAGDLKRACLTCYKKAVNTTETVTLGFSHSYQPYQAKNESKQIESTSDITSEKPKTDTEVWQSRESSLSDVNSKEDELPSWADSLVFLSKLGARNSTTFQFPPNSISEDFLADVIENAMPKSLSVSSLQDVNFLFRYRDRVSLTPKDEADKKQEESDEEDETSSAYVEEYEDIFYNCYVSYRQRSFIDGTSGTVLYRQAIVLISRWSFPQLAFRLLSKLDEAIYWQNNKSIVQLSPSIPVNMLTIGFGQVMLWPQPQLDSSVYFPFLGEMLQYKILPDVWQTLYCDVTLSPAQWPANLVALFGPLGLLKHLWVVWEFLVTGQDILIYSSSPAHCSEFAIAIATILAPLNFLGDIRPHVSAKDSSLHYIRQQAMKHQEDRQSSDELSSRALRKMTFIVGTSEASVVDLLSVFKVAIFLSPPPIATADMDTIYLGFRQRNAADIKVLDRDQSPLSTLLKEWEAKGKEKSVIYCYIEPSVSPNANILNKVKQMSKRERFILGEKLLRDHFRSLTFSYLTSPDEIPVEEEDLQAAQTYRRKKMTTKLKFAKRSQRPIKKKIPKAVVYLDRIALSLRTSPEIALENVPSLILWAIYALLLSIYSLFGLPLVVVVALLFVVKIPIKAPNEFEELLSSVIPSQYLYPLRSEEVPSGSKAIESKTAIAPLPPSSITSSQINERVDLSGVWKRTKCINYENFLGAQGVGYVQRRLAANINMIHTITMDGDGLSAFRLQEKAGPIDSDNLYEINESVTKTTTLGKKEFIDQVFWDSSNVLTIKKVHVPERDYELVVKRYLEEKGNIIRLVAVFTDLMSVGKSVETTCYFEKTGPSPNDPPKSFAAPQSKAASTVSSSNAEKVVEKKAAIKRTDFTGTWQRTKSVNFEEFIGAQGAGFMQRKLAAAMPLTHTIVMNSELTALRLKETGGPLDLDTSYTIGNDFITTKILKNQFREKMYWDGPNAIVLHRLCLDGSYELIMTRQVDDEGKQVILKSIHRDLKTLHEVEATSWFTKTGIPTLTPPVPVPLPPSAVFDIRDEKPNKANADIEYESDDDDNDAVAMRKRLKSMQITRSSQSRNNVTEKKDRLDDSIARPDEKYAGIWERQQALNMKAVQYAPKDRESLARALTVVHHIEFITPVRIRVKEVLGSQIVTDTVFDIAADYISTNIDDHDYEERVYLEGNLLVQSRVHKSREYEYLFQRYLENDGDMMRLITLHKNLLTGVDSETMTIFHKKKE